MPTNAPRRGETGGRSFSDGYSTVTLAKSQIRDLSGR
jgi:hypothetical protein